MLDGTTREARLRLSMGRARSVLDPAQTQPSGVGWKEEGLETDHWHQLVESVLGVGGARVGSVGGECRRSLQMSSKFAKKIAKIYTSIAEICKNSPDLH